MRCRYCNLSLALLRGAADDEFCCDDHRQAFEIQEAAFAAESSEFTSDPDCGVETADRADHSASTPPVANHTRVLQRNRKLAGLVALVVLSGAVAASIRKAPVPLKQLGNLDQVQDHWKYLNQTISDRAAIAYADDFRSGLDAWESRSNLTASWSYDAAGFVRPGPLAVFKPTVDLSDYSFEFLGEIDQKALGWVFRAENLKNYYAMKFVVAKPGPLPLVHMIRYAVIDGREGPHIEKPLPLTARADTLYRIQVNARGGDFTIMAQGQVVDFWSDSRLRRGGVGFFCNRGERARLRWVEVSHQYDALGRLCAYLAPYGIEGRNGSIN